jgi:hypothetical protein
MQYLYNRIIFNNLIKQTSKRYNSCYAGNNEIPPNSGSKIVNCCILLGGFYIGTKIYNRGAR